MFFLLSIILFSGCKIFYSNDITVTAEYNYKGDTCKVFCHQIDLYVKNNTGKKIYIKGLKGIINNKLYTWYKRPSFRKSSFSYWRAHYETKHDCPKCTCKYSDSNTPQPSPPGFIEKAEKREMEIYRSINDFSCHDSIIIHENKIEVNSKYNESTIFLLPNEECLIDCSYIDPYISLNKKYRIYYLIGKRNRRKKDYYKFKDRMHNRTIKIWSGYLKEIAGYKFFEGKAKSNTLVIKNGKVIKNKPVPK